ncbi:hypothetical protein FDECE_13434 [Fusarium decemcellulare]|nr:hypothetical protein FDECE_13434 [Fusarium decemcellulare]
MDLHLDLDLAFTSRLNISNDDDWEPKNTFLDTTQEITTPVDTTPQPQSRWSYSNTTINSTYLDEPPKSRWSYSNTTIGGSTFDSSTIDGSCAEGEIWDCEDLFTPTHRRRHDSASTFRPTSLSYSTSTESWTGSFLTEPELTPTEDTTSSTVPSEITERRLTRASSLDSFVDLNPRVSSTHRISFYGRLPEKIKNRYLSDEEKVAVEVYSRCASETSTLLHEKGCTCQSTDEQPDSADMDDYHTFIRPESLPPPKRSCIHHLSDDPESTDSCLPGNIDITTALRSSGYVSSGLWVRKQPGSNGKRGFLSCPFTLRSRNNQR